MRPCVFSSFRLISFRAWSLNCLESLEIMSTFNWISQVSLRILRFPDIFGVPRLSVQAELHA